MLTMAAAAAAAAAANESRNHCNCTVHQLSCTVVAAQPDADS